MYDNNDQNPYRFQNNSNDSRPGVLDVRTQMARVAFLLSIAGLALFTTFIFSLPLAGVAILLAVLSARADGKREMRANIALIVAIASIILCYVTLISTMWLFLNSPELQAQLDPSFKRMYGISVEDAVAIIRNQLGLK